MGLLTCRECGWEFDPAADGQGEDDAKSCPGCGSADVGVTITGEQFMELYDYVTSAAAAALKQKLQEFGIEIYRWDFADAPIGKWVDEALEANGVEIEEI